MSSIQVDGVISGLDTTSLIDALVSAYGAPKDTLEEKQTDLEDRKEALTELVSLVEDLQSALTDIQTASDFKAYSASYADNDAFSVSVSGSAVAGVYSIAVSQVATSEMEVSQGFSDATAGGVLATGTMDVTYNGTTTTITVDSTTSLADLASMIDDIDGITAYVMDTGDATSPYRLVVQGDDTGADYGITIDTSGLTGAGTVPTFTEVSTAQDAQLSINGVSITSASNTVTDAVPGLTITLTGTTTSAIDVTVNLDTSAMEEKVQAFVDAFNAVMSHIEDNSEYDADQGVRGSYVGESTVRSVRYGLLSLISTEYTGLSQDIDALSLVGIGTDGSGMLEFDTAEFEDALSTYGDQVVDLFTGTGGFVETALDKLDLYIDPYDGTIQNRIDTLEEQISDLEDQISEWEDRITSYEERLREQFDNMESLLGTMQSSSDYLTAFLTSLMSSSS